MMNIINWFSFTICSKFGSRSFIYEKEMKKLETLESKSDCISSDKKFTGSYYGSPYPNDCVKPNSKESDWSSKWTG